MVYKNCRGVGGRWCQKTAVGRVSNGVRKLPSDRCVMVYENRRWAVQDGVLKSLSRCGIVFNNRRWAGAQWCKETTVGACVPALIHHLRQQEPRYAGAAIHSRIIIGYV